ncbi:MAG: cell division protein FtsZ [Patescibacteria group bacterium]
MSKNKFTEVKPDIETFAKIKVVGVGGSGGSAISRMVAAGLKGVEFLAINTDAQALHHVPSSKKIHIGKSTTRGLGAGMDPDIGMKAAEESQEEIQDALKGADMVFLTCGLGGGTGSGASPMIADLARESGALTVGVVTKPFGFEGEQRRSIAESALGELEDKLDTIITIPNDKLLQIIDKKTSLLDSFKIVDEVLHQGVQGISDLITIPGLINVDFADVKSVMENAGSSLMGIGTASGENRAIEAAKAAVDSPLLDLSIDGAKGILFTVTGGENLSMFEINEAAKVITESADTNARIIFGSVIDEKMEDEVKITVVATGFGKGQRSTKKVQAQAVSPFGAGAQKTADLTPDDEVQETPTIQVSNTAGFSKKDFSNQAPVNNTPEEADGSEEDLEIPAFIRKKMM